MADFSTYVDIEPKEFVDNCSSQEVKELINILIEEGYLEGEPVTSPTHHNLLDEEWVKIISKLIKSRLLLSNDEESLIRNIANRF
jgi:ribosomal protein S8